MKRVKIEKRATCVWECPYCYKKINEMVRWASGYSVWCDECGKDCEVE